MREIFKKIEGREWDNFNAGAWVELKDPADDATLWADKKSAGVKVRFGGGEQDPVIAIPNVNISFEGAFLDSVDTIQAWLDSLIYQRTIDVIDLQGSTERYDELRLFYKSPRLVVTESGVPLLYTLVEYIVTEEYSWELFTGFIDPSCDPYVRSSVAIDSFTEVIDADTEATAVISMLTIFKDMYTDFINTSFSTDTDEYDDSEEEFDI